jgi:hypothetical protein
MIWRAAGEFHRSSMSGSRRPAPSETAIARSAKGWAQPSKRRNASDDSTAAIDPLNCYKRKCQGQQEVNEPARSVSGHYSEHPHQEKHEADRPQQNRGLRNILVAEATFLDTSRMQPRYAASESGAGYFIELFTANIRDGNP